MRYIAPIACQECFTFESTFYDLGTGRRSGKQPEGQASPWTVPRQRQAPWRSAPPRA
jgi:hypothetical protein